MAARALCTFPGSSIQPRASVLSASVAFFLKWKRPWVPRGLTDEDTSLRLCSEGVRRLSAVLKEGEDNARGRDRLGRTYGASWQSGFLRTERQLQRRGSALEGRFLKVRVVVGFSSVAGDREGESPVEPVQSVLVLYSKEGCCLCTGLKEKLEVVMSMADKGSLEGVTIEVRDITSREEWERLYQYEIPVMARLTASGEEVPIPRQSPRVTVERLKKHLQSAFS